MMSKGICSLGEAAVPDPKLKEQALPGQREGDFHASTRWIALVYIFDVSD